MLTLFHAARSRSSRILWLLEELGADYRLRRVGIRYQDGRGGAPDPTNIHPDKKVPALDHDGVLVTESHAVALYLTELHPEAGLAPHPGDADRGPFLTWMAWAEGEFGPALFMPEIAPLAAFLAKARGEVFQRLEAALAEGPYLLGERFSAADVMVGMALAGWDKRALLPESAAIDGYIARLQARPAYVRAMAEDDAPAQAA